MFSIITQENSWQSHHNQTSPTKSKISRKPIKIQRQHSWGCANAISSSTLIHYLVSNVTPFLSKPPHHRVLANGSSSSKDTMLRECQKQLQLYRPCARSRMPSCSTALLQETPATFLQESCTSPIASESTSNLHHVISRCKQTQNVFNSNMLCVALRGGYDAFPPMCVKGSLLIAIIQRRDGN
jgi:hypothetical protein